MKYILAVDGGGSKTIVQIADVKGKVVNQTVSGSSSYKSVGMSKAIENLNKALEQKRIILEPKLIIRNSCKDISKK